MANKELSLGCMVRFNKWIYTIIDKKNVWFLDSYRGKDWDIHNTIVIEDGVNSRCYSIEEVIWHPVMIGDALDWIENKKFNVDTPIVWFWFDDEDYDDETKLFLIQIYYSEKVCSLWEHKRKSIEEQSNGLVDFIYGLISSISME